MTLMGTGGRSRAGSGCLSTLVGVVVVVAIVIAVVFVGFIALGVFAALVAIGLLALVVDRILLAVSPKRRERRVKQGGVFVWRLGPDRFGDVVDATATETPADPEELRSRPEGTDDLGPE
jgi:hypothetical protein